jgi:hypothetical protein
VRRPALVALVLLASCADILGIDDGTPRTYEDASIDVANDVTTLPDVKNEAAPDVAPETAPNSPLPCGDASCNAYVEACCRTGSQTQVDAQAFACVASDASCGGLKVTCADNANCAAQGHPGEECCAFIPDGGSIATSTGCIKASACSGGDMCTPGDDENCTGEAGCLPSVQTIVGWTICK